MQALLTTYQTRIQEADSLEALEQVRVALLGKQGLLTERLKALGAMEPGERKRQGAEINSAKAVLQEALKARKAQLEQLALAGKLNAERIDVSLPGRHADPGTRHPISQTIERIVGILRSMGYESFDGPEIEDDFHNFEALNFPAHHPARAMHDTFYLPDGRLLRTHTSPIQIRAMRGRQPPIRGIAAGKVYRSDSDQTHSPMFHQIEGFWVDETTTFADLKGTLHHFIQAFFERPLETQFRPSYFPFTEPSVEVDIRWERPDGEASWLEVLGGGMIHPRVLQACGIDPERYTGFAFGLGVERFAMLRYRVQDLRAFFENDLVFLRQFA